MKKATNNTFNQGMIKDLNPLTTPNDVLTDCLNGTLITYNGNEFVLQNDMGNCKVERAKLPVGFIPLGMKEYGGIIYVAAYNPETKECEIGSFPSPERDFSTKDFNNVEATILKDSDFYVITDMSDTSGEKLVKVAKLFEPELFQLNPGDKYVVTYDINDPGGTEEKITDKESMDEYISDDSANRKLFRLKFYKINDNNNLIELNTQDFNYIEDKVLDDNDYAYFKENSQGTLAVGLEVETLDYFQTNAVDSSRRTDDNKKIYIEAVGYSDSLSDFEGVLVEVTEPAGFTPESFYLEKTDPSVRKVSATIDELDPESVIKGTMTPYSKYNFFPSLKQDFQVELGKFASAGAGVNNIFRYYVTDNFAKIDFDFKFEGDNPNGLHLYVELYDLWSGFSIVKTVDSPTSYGINSVTFDLEDRPRNKIYDAYNATNPASGQTGGISWSLLQKNQDNLNKTILNNSGTAEDNFIRSTSTLRKNHFYIVRISGVDIDSSTDPATYTYYDLYKVMYTNKVLNSVYEKQSTITSTSPEYVEDFNTIRLKVEDIIDTSITTTETRVLITKLNPEWTKTAIDSSAIITNAERKPYEFNESNLAVSGIYKTKEPITAVNDLIVNTRLTGVENIFGDIKSEIVSYDLPTPLEQTYSIEDFGYDATSDPSGNIAPDSTVEQTYKNITPGQSFTIERKLRTNRNTYANRVLESGPSFPIKLHWDLEAKPFLNYRAVDLAARLSKVTINGAYDIDNCDNDAGWPNPQNLYSIIRDTWIGSGMMPLVVNIGFWDRRSKSYCRTSDEWHDVLMRIIEVKDGYIKGTVDCILHGDGYYMSLDNDNAMLDVIRNAPVGIFKIHSIEDVNTYVYYADSSSVISNSSVVTTVDFDTFLRLKFQPIALTKTYVSNVVFKSISTNTTVDFSTANVNSYIDSIVALSPTHIQIDGGSEINDNHIPWISSEVTKDKPISSNELSISAAADASIVTAYINANTNWRQDPNMLNSSEYTHGQFYTVSNDPVHRALARSFTVFGLPPGVKASDGSGSTPRNCSVIIINDSSTRRSGQNYVWATWMGSNGRFHGPQQPLFQLKR